MVQKVLQSSKIPPNYNINFENFNDFNYNQDLKSFYWDNIDAFYNKEVKKGLKSLIEEEKEMVPKLKFGEVIGNLIKKSIISKVNPEKIAKFSVVLIASFIIQLIISKKVRNISFSFLQTLIFLLTSAGISSAVYMLLLKDKDKTEKESPKERKTSTSFKI